MVLPGGGAPEFPRLSLVRVGSLIEHSRWTATAHDA